MFSALRGLIYLLCHEEVNAINTSIPLFHAERQFPSLNAGVWACHSDFLTQRFCFSYEFSEDFGVGWGQMTLFPSATLDSLLLSCTPLLSCDPTLSH